MTQNAVNNFLFGIVVGMIIQSIFKIMPEKMESDN
jgi:tetrahydromethanopterin S-methyltransferase subunit G